MTATQIDYHRRDGWDLLDKFTSFPSTPWPAMWMRIVHVASMPLWFPIWFGGMILLGVIGIVVGLTWEWAIKPSKEVFNYVTQTTK